MVTLSLWAALGFLAVSGAVAKAAEGDSSPAPTAFPSRQDFHRWDRFVRGFRREHNFALSTGVSSGTWKVSHFGTLNDRTFDNSGVYAKFQYSYHIQIYEGFGYMLGSSTGYHYESADRRSVFRPVDATQFPSVLAGLVFNFSPMLRILAAGEAYLERHVGIEEHDGDGEDPKIAVTLTAYEASAAIDVFYELAWALRLEAHQRRLIYKEPLHSEGFPLEAKLTKEDQWLGLALVYHLI